MYDRIEFTELFTSVDSTVLLEDHKSCHYVKCFASKRRFNKS